MRDLNLLLGQSLPCDMNMKNEIIRVILEDWCLRQPRDSHMFEWTATLKERQVNHVYEITSSLLYLGREFVKICSLFFILATEQHRTSHGNALQDQSSHVGK